MGFDFGIGFVQNLAYVLAVFGFTYEHQGCSGVPGAVTFFIGDVAEFFEVFEGFVWWMQMVERGAESFVFWEYSGDVSGDASAGDVDDSVYFKWSCFFEIAKNGVEEQAVKYFGGSEEDFSPGDTVFPFFLVPIRAKVCFANFSGEGSSV